MMYRNVVNADLLIDEETKIAAAVDPYDVKKGERSTLWRRYAERLVSVIAAAEREGVKIGSHLRKPTEAPGD